MRKNFEQLTKWVLVHEGGYVNHPEDPGGPTNKGITQRVYDAYRKRKKLSTRSVKDITDEEVKTILKEQAWDKVWGDKLPSGLDYSMYDFAINSGPARAVKFLQNLVGVAEDGIMGNLTIGAVLDHEDIEELIKDLNYKRWNWLKRLKTFKTFGKGWTRRVMGSKEGFQEDDYGVIDRSVMLFRGDNNIQPPKSIDDEANRKTYSEDLKLTEELKEGMTFDNIAKIGAGSIPAFITTLSSLPPGPLQWAFAAGTVMMFAIVSIWLVKKLV